MISYLNHLHDPFLGQRFTHDSRNNKWIPNKRGHKVLPESTNMCKLIEYGDLPDNFKCK